MSKAEREDIIAEIDRYYTGRLHEHGATPRGVDWNSTAAQEVRFDQLLKIIGEDPSPSILDYGCGYGAFAPYLLKRRPDSTLVGYDISAAMIAKAHECYGGDARVRFTSDHTALSAVDYVVASGVFSVKLGIATARWEEYIKRTIDTLADLAGAGFAFNMLTAYSDRDRMRNDLYYGDPLYFFEYVRTRFSRNVALLHDYGIYEFTLHVRRKNE